MATVQIKASKGTTLNDMAKIFGVSVQELKKANNLTSNNLQEGQTLSYKVDNVEALKSRHLALQAERQSNYDNQKKVYDDYQNKLKSSQVKTSRTDYGDLNQNQINDYALNKSSKGWKSVDDYKNYLKSEGSKNKQIVDGTKRLTAGILGTAAAIPVVAGVGGTALYGAQTILPKAAGYIASELPIAKLVGGVVANGAKSYAGSVAANPYGAIGGVAGSIIGGKEVNNIVDKSSNGKYSTWGDMVNKTTGIPTVAGDLTNPGSAVGAVAGSTVGNVGNFISRNFRKLLGNAASSSRMLSNNAGTTIANPRPSLTGALMPVNHSVNKKAQASYLGFLGRAPGGQMVKGASEYVPRQESPLMPLINTPNSYGAVPIFTPQLISPKVTPTVSIGPISSQVLPNEVRYEKNTIKKGGNEFERWFRDQINSGNRGTTQKFNGKDYLIEYGDKPTYKREVYAETDNNGKFLNTPVLVPDSTSEVRRNIVPNYNSYIRQLDGGVDPAARRDYGTKLK